MLAFFLGVIAQLSRKDVVTSFRIDHFDLKLNEEPIKTFLNALTPRSEVKFSQKFQNFQFEAFILIQHQLIVIDLQGKL